MFKVIRKQTRPNTNVPFWQGQNDPSMTEEFRTYFYENYILTGKFISATPDISANGLELTTTAIWNSESDCDASIQDSVVQEGLRDKMRAHSTNSGVVMVEVSRETF